MDLSWSEFKTYLSNKTNAQKHYVELEDAYIIEAINGPFRINCIISKGTSDATDFTTNYQVAWDKDWGLKLDTDNAQIVNPKLATEGRSYQSIFATLTTAKYNGVIAKDENNQNDTQFVCRIYDANGDEITSSANESQAVLTTVEWEPTVAYDIQGFCLYQKAQPTTDIFLNVIAAHHIPAAYGGSKVAIKGCNLRFAPYGARESDWVGDSTSAIALDTTYYSHHQILKLYHNAGVQHEAMLEVIWYV